MNTSWPRVGRIGLAVAASAAVILGSAACSGDAASPVSGSSSTTSRGPFTPIKADATIGLAFPMGSRVEPVVNAALTKAGFKVQSRFATTGDDQATFIGMILDAKPAVLVVDALDAGKLKDRLDRAQKDGVVVIAATALPKDDTTIDYFVGADPKARGEAQAQALLTGTAGRRAKEAQRLEVFAGSAADAAAKISYDAIMATLKPKLDDKSVEIPSGDTDFGKVATGTAADAKNRMAGLLKDKYGDQAPEGVVAADDAVALGVLQAVTEAKRQAPYVVGGLASYDGVAALMQGRLGATTWDDPTALGTAIAQLVTDLKGKDWPATDKNGISTGKADVPARLLAPVSTVTRGNAATLLGKDEALKKLLG